jgi:pyruvate ferredoxin oxidoreductase alpha subunit
MVCLEGFILSHTYMPVRIPEQKEIDAFLPPYNSGWVLDVDNPLSHANMTFPEWYMEFRYKIQEAMENARRLIPYIDREYGKIFGFEYGGMIEKYMCEDADLILLTMGTMGVEAKIAVDALRKDGIKVGSARVRVFRPFPTNEIRKLAKETQMFAVIDRHISFGMEGFLATECKASLSGERDKPLVAGFIAGLGGRDVTYETIKKIAKKSLRWLRMGKVERETEWVDLRR